MSSFLVAIIVCFFQGKPSWSYILFSYHFIYVNLFPALQHTLFCILISLPNPKISCRHCNLFCVDSYPGTHPSLPKVSFAHLITNLHYKYLFKLYFLELFFGTHFFLPKEIFSKVFVADLNCLNLSGMEYPPAFPLWSPKRRTTFLPVNPPSPGQSLQTEDISICRIYSLQRIQIFISAIILFTNMINFLLHKDNDSPSQIWSIFYKKEDKYIIKSWKIHNDDMFPSYILHIHIHNY